MTAFYFKFVQAVQGLRDREEGQTLAEYALILALIAILCLTALSVIQGGISSALTTIGNTISGA